MKLVTALVVLVLVVGTISTAFVLLVLRPLPSIDNVSAFLAFR